MHVGSLTTDGWGKDDRIDLVLFQAELAGADFFDRKLNPEATDPQLYAGAASSPSQKISYITGKWQIMRLLGRYRDRQGASFRLGAFHDQLISYGTLPLSVIEWLMFDDESTLREALK
jgi:uncharacterized protein DUF885